MKIFTLKKNIAILWLILNICRGVNAIEIIPLNTIEIEKTIRSKVNHAISYVANEKEYIVNVQIEKMRKKPKKKKGSSKNKKNNEIIPIENIKGEVDYLVYHRLGLSNVVKEDIKEEVIVLSEDPIEEIIKSVSIEVLHSKEWDADKIKKITSIVEKLKYGISINPIFSMTSIDMGIAEAKKIKDLQEAAKIIKKKTISDLSIMEMADLISKFSTSMGLILGTLILALVGFVVVGKFSKNQKDQTDALIKSNKEIAEAQSGGSEDNGGVAVSTIDEVNVSSESNSNEDVEINSKENNLIAIEKFTSFMNKNLMESVTFIKKWLYDETDDSVEALTLLALEMESELLMKLLDELDTSERYLWKQKVSEGGSQSSLGASFIKKQILEEVIVPSDVLSEETKTELFNINPKICIEIISENEKLGALLFSVLSSKFITKLMLMMKEEEIITVTSLCDQLSISQLKELNDPLLKKIKEKKVGTKQSLFGEKVFDLLPLVGPDKQKVLLDFVGKAGDVEKLKRAITQFFPLEGIYQLNDDALKFFLTKIPQKKMIELIVVSEDSISEKFLSAVAPEGSSKRDMLKIEIDNIKKNEIELKKLNNNKNEVEIFFLNVVRKLINVNITVKNMVEPNIDNLVSTYINNEHQDVASAA